MAFSCREKLDVETTKLVPCDGIALNMKEPNFRTLKLLLTIFDILPLTSAKLLAKVLAPSPHFKYFFWWWLLRLKVKRFISVHQNLGSP